MNIMASQDLRLIAANNWLNNVALSEKNYSIQPASADASFRRYFRITAKNESYILMDAPPEHGDCKPFINVATLLAKHGLNVPDIIQHDIEQGFLLLSDLGTTTYLSALNSNSVSDLYNDALEALCVLQTKVPTEDLAIYDQKLLSFEVSLFIDWFLIQHKKINLDTKNHTALINIFTSLTNSALEQPKVFVHRDYHSRNLMVTDTQNPGILDFQDALYGPITYDLVSLLKDCYITNSDTLISALVDEHYNNLYGAKFISSNKQQFTKWFDWMGMQRHLKAIGIFARLLHRDNKPNYIQDIPRTMQYIKKVCQNYSELEKFDTLMHDLNIEEYTAS